MTSYKEMIEYLVHYNVSGICIDRYDCSLPDQECCMNQCVGNNNCFGIKCSLDSQCGYDETCCRGSCAGQCDSTLRLILGCVFTALFLILVVTVVVWLCKRRARSLHQLGRRLLAPLNDSRTVRANQCQPYYGGIPQSYLPPCTPYTYRHEYSPQTNIPPASPNPTRYPVPRESRYPGQGHQTASVRGAVAMEIDPPPPYASYEQAMPASINTVKEHAPGLLDTGERAVPSAPSLVTDLTLPHEKEQS